MPLILIGLGERPSADPTLDAVAALADCDAAVCVGLGADALERVKAVAAKTASFDDPDDPRAASELSRLLAAGRNVAWVGPGHPAECAPRAGGPARVAKAVCSLDAQLIARREVLSNGPAYYPPGGAAAAAPDDGRGEGVIRRADWSPSASARARAAKDLLAKGRKAFAAKDDLEALRLCHEAAVLDWKNPAAYEWLARVQLRQGRAHEAWSMLWEAELLGGKGLRPLLDETLAALGRPGETSAARKKKFKPGAGRPHAERADGLTAKGELDAARAAWNAAIAAEPSAGMFDARAAWLAKYGLPLESLSDRREALRLTPTPDRRAAYAERLRRARYHELARKELDRAAKGAGATADVFVQRAAARLRTGDWKGALADAAQARKRGAPPERLLLVRAEAAAASGRAELKAAFADAGPFESAWLDGYARLSEKRPDPKPFVWAAALAGGDERRARAARTFAALARAWDWCPAPAREPGLTLCGLGIAPESGSMTAECVAALRASDVVFQNSASDTIGALLRVLCRDIRPSPFHHEFDVLRLVESMFAEARKGKSVAMATFGHPLLFGPIAQVCLSRGARENIPVRVVAAPSTLGEMLSAGARLGPVRRWQVLVGLARGSTEAAARLDPSAPLLLYPEGPPGFLENVAGRYPEDHKALVLSQDSQEWDAARETPLRDVVKLPPEAHKQRLVFVPPAP